MPAALSPRQALHPGGWLLLASLACLAASCTLDRRPRAAVEPQPDAAGTSPVEAMPGGAKRWCFEKDAVCFDADFPTARLQQVTRQADGSYRLVVRPEVEPINPSPWYGFRVRSTAARTVSLHLDYAGYRHRYAPWTRRDGGAWTRVPGGDVRPLEEGGVRVDLRLRPGNLDVSAQPPVTAAHYDQWAEQIAEQMAFPRERIGHSVRGQPLWMYRLGDSQARRCTVVIGRQHPPESTGALALTQFVSALASPEPWAARYRQRHLTLVIPLLNPDGVAAGHWRGNAHGKDLNRDWGPFGQPETRAARDALLAATRHCSVGFVIDFHSTWNDVLYTVEEDPSRREGGVLRRWIDAMQHAFPGRVREETYAATSTVFKNWAFNTWGAPSLTYEVGDDTDAGTLAEVAHEAARAMADALTPENAERR